MPDRTLTFDFPSLSCPNRSQIGDFFSFSSSSPRTCRAVPCHSLRTDHPSPRPTFPRPKTFRTIPHQAGPSLFRPDIPDHPHPDRFVADIPPRPAPVPAQATPSRAHPPSPTQEGQAPKPCLALSEIESAQGRTYHPSPLRSKPNRPTVPGQTIPRRSCTPPRPSTNPTAPALSLPRLPYPSQHTLALRCRLELVISFFRDLPSPPAPFLPIPLPTHPS